MTSESDLGLLQIPDYRQGVRTLSLAAAIWMSTSLVGADTPVGGAGVLAGEVPQDLPANLGVTPALPDSIHFGKCLDLIELQDGTIIMMVGAPDDDDKTVWSQGNAADLFFVYKIFWSIRWSIRVTPFINEGDLVKSQVISNSILTHSPENSLMVTRSRCRSGGRLPCSHWCPGPMSSTSTVKGLDAGAAYVFRLEMRLLGC